MTDRSDARPRLVPYLIARDARGAVAFYEAVFGATSGTPIVMDDGRVGHVELRLSEATIYLADEFPELGYRAAGPEGTTAISLALVVDDVDAVAAAAEARGAVIEEPPADEARGDRVAKIRDPFGHRWIVQTPIG